MAERISTADIYNRTTASITNTQLDLAKLNKQITSGKKADTFTGLGNDVNRVLSLEASIKESERFIRGNQTIVNRLNVMDLALSQMIEVAQQFKSNIANELSPSAPSQNLSAIADNTLDIIADSLNRQEASRSLFAGSKTDTPAVGDLKAVTNLLDGQPTANYYLGDDLTFTIQATRQTTVEYGIKANDTAFQNLIGAVNMAISAEESGLHENMVTASDMLDDALSQLINLRSKIGANIETLEDSNVQHEGVKFQLESVLGQVTETDIVQASIEVSMNEALLTATMQTFARITSLNLTDFLR